MLIINKIIFLFEKKNQDYNLRIVLSGQVILIMIKLSLINTNEE